MKTESAAAPLQEMLRRPPRMSTCTSESSSPRRIPAAAAAQAPVPQARVSPTPRSKTRSRAWPRSTICMKPAFTRCAKRAWFAISGPVCCTGALSTSSTHCTACGLPMATMAIQTLVPDAAAPSASGHCCAAPRGMACRPDASKGRSAGSKRGHPMSTVTRPSGVSRGAITPPRVCTRRLSLCVRPLSRTKRAKQRAPLPHCSTSPPSALWIRYSKSIPGAGEGRTLRIWSAPTPKWRSARKRYWAADSPRHPRVSSSTTKSLPAPCILVKRTCIAGLSPLALALRERRQDLPVPSDAVLRQSARCGHGGCRTWHAAGPRRAAAWASRVRSALLGAGWGVGGAFCLIGRAGAAGIRYCPCAPIARSAKTFGNPLDQ